MNREAELRRYLRTHHPETRFVGRAPNPAGIYFGVVKNDPERKIIPMIHAWTLWDRSARLDDQEFGQLELGLSRLIETVYELTDRDEENWFAEIMDVVRSTLIETDPELEAVLAKCWEVE